MKKARIITPFDNLAYWIAAQLEPLGYQADIISNNEGFRLSHGKHIPAADVLSLKYAIEPFNPGIEKLSSDTDVDIEICLAAGADQKPLEVTLVSPQTPAVSKISSALEDNHFVMRYEPKHFFEHDLIVHNNAPTFQRQLLRWLLEQQGYHPIEKNETSADLEADAIQLNLVPRDFQPEAASRQLPIAIYSDNEKEAHQLKDGLSRSGFEKIHLYSLSRKKSKNTHFLIKARALSRLAAYDSLQDIKQQVKTLMADHDIDENAYPLKVKKKFKYENVEPLITKIYLPISACQSGERLPYAGDFPARFTVTIEADAEDYAKALEEKLKSSGFINTRIKQVTPGEMQKFSVIWKDAHKCPTVSDSIQTITSDFLRAHDVSPDFEFSFSRVSGLEQALSSLSGNEIKIKLPMQDAVDGKLIERILSGELYELSWFANNEEEWNGIEDFFNQFRFKACKYRGADENTTNDWIIKYGGASQLFLNRLCEKIKAKYEATPVLKKAWNDSDNDVFITLPEAPAEQNTDTTQILDASLMALDFASTSQPEDTGHPFIYTIEQHLKIGEILLPYSKNKKHSRLVPSAEQFSHFCIDSNTAETLMHIAQSVLLREPCLLEGETSTSKTSSLLYLASLLRQPVVRINLNGQTDTSEMIGRFIPGEDLHQLPFCESDLLAASERLDPRSRTILQQAQSECRALTPLEVQQIKTYENMTSQQWHWKNGLLVDAIQHGWWVLLDECNLAEPQILERLNSVLEKYASLVLTEYDNSVLGTADSPVHADFRIFATMNPADYAGRSPLSPAFMDRWRGYRYVPAANEQVYSDMLCTLVLGESPDILLAGKKYTPEARLPLYPELAKQENIRDFLLALARFHTSLERACSPDNGPAPLGANQRTPGVFTRRGLLSFLDYTEHRLKTSRHQNVHAVLREGLERYYLNRMNNDKDKQVVFQLLDATGIGPNTWILTSPETSHQQEAEICLY